MTADQFTDAVRQCKADLEAQGVPLTGACGAWRITNLFAWRHLQFWLLEKGGGNRAVPQPDGTCLDGNQSNLPLGYATDYVIDVQHGHVGYDLLGDGGGANAPQWRGPEDAPDMVARNREHARPPVNPASYYREPPTVVVDPPPPPPPPPPADAVAFELAQLREQVELLHAVVEHVALVQARGLTGSGNLRYLGPVTFTLLPTDAKE